MKHNWECRDIGIFGSDYTCKTCGETSTTSSGCIDSMLARDDCPPPEVEPGKYIPRKALKRANSLT